MVSVGDEAGALAGRELDSVAVFVAVLLTSVSGCGYKTSVVV